MNRGWIGVDLDGTLAHYDEWKGIDHIGEPVPAMVARVQNWLHSGIDVQIVTARVCRKVNPQEAAKAEAAIHRWCIQHIGIVLGVRSDKDFGMIELWDDRCVRVEKNTGRILSGTGSNDSN
jgi:hypothetical protein